MKPNPIALAVWMAYGYTKRAPQQSLSWTAYINAGAPAKYIGKR